MPRSAAPRALWDGQTFEWKEKLYFFHALCPQCAKHYGHNRLVLPAQVA